MRLNHIYISNYKNLEQADVSFSPCVNCFVGSNGMGKTNLLDAIYYLSFCKSSTNPSDAFNMRHGSDFFMIQGQYETDGGVDMKISCGVKTGAKKRVRCDGKDYKRLSQHVGRIPLVMVSPSDSALVSGGSEERRRMMDSVISQYRPAYLESIIKYDKALKQRNAALKSEAEPAWDVVDVLEEIMSGEAELIFRERKAFVEEFVPIFRDIYRNICPENAAEDIDIGYESHGLRGNLKPLLEQGRAIDRAVGYTRHGVHKDELVLLLNGYPVKREASQGQTKTYFIALKLAQYIFLKGKGERNMPILLLDDIFDKLDAKRVGRIVNFVSGGDFGQTFITDTNRENIDRILASTTEQYSLFEVENGEVDLITSGVEGRENARTEVQNATLDKIGDIIDKGAEREGGDEA